MVDWLKLRFIFYVRVKKLQIEGGHEGKAGWANGKARWALPTLKGLIISSVLGKDQFKKRETIFGIVYLLISRNA